MTTGAAVDLQACKTQVSKRCGNGKTKDYTYFIISVTSIGAAAVLVAIVSCYVFNRQKHSTTSEREPLMVNDP